MISAEYVAKFLEKRGITHIFELTGGMISYLLDAFHLHTQVEIISVHHEQAAAFAADAWSRVKNLPGVAIASSGQGAINLLTGIGNCYFDSVPGIFITGQVNTNEQKGNSEVRQLGFQETDIVSMAHPVCKKVFKVESVETIPGILEEAWQISVSGRPGPVLIDIPMNLQRTELPEDFSVNPASSQKLFSASGSATFINELIQALQKAQNPLILAGRGIRASGSTPAFRTFCETTGIPVISSLLGIDLLEYEHPLRVGFIGVYGNRWANMAIHDCDLMIVLGSRLDIRQTGADTESFASGKKIFHVDCEKAELNYRIPDCSILQADLADFFEASLKTIKNEGFPNYTAWKQKLQELRAQHPDTGELKNISGIHPNVFLHRLSKASQAAGCYLADVGNHQMWCAQSLEIGKNQLFITSGGMGAMGYALPAAMGASLAGNRQKVVTISGDGGFQINIQELQTIAHNQLPIKMVVLNNQSLGMIRQFQDSYFDSRHIASIWGYSAPDFAQIARAYGIAAETICREEEIESVLIKMWEHPDQPFLLQVMLQKDVNAFPKIAFGSPIHIMEPLIDETNA